jgi:hypothetical protein
VGTRRAPKGGWGTPLLGLVLGFAWDPYLYLGYTWALLGAPLLGLYLGYTWALLGPTKYPFRGWSIPYTCLLHSLYYWFYGIPMVYVFIREV